MRGPRLTELALLASLIPLPLTAVALAGQTEAPKKVLVLYWYNKDFPGNVAFDQGFRTALQSARRGAVEYYPEYFETNRLPGDQSPVLFDYLRRKYAELALDVVVASGFAVQEFLLKHHADLFPRTPVVFVGVERPATQELAAGAGVTGVVLYNTHRRTLDLAMKLHPDRDHVYIVSGTLDRDGKFERLARKELEGYQGGAQITYMTDLDLDELVQKVKSLPERSVVLYVWQQLLDKEGRRLESADVLALIAQSTPVPIYGMSGANIGNGIIGGYVFTIEGNGATAAEMAMQIAHGARAQEIQVRSAPTAPMFDWRQLQRWKISEDALPLGSIVRFRPLTLWNAYRWYIIGIILLCLVETVLVCGLLIQRARYKRVQKGLRESEQAVRESNLRIKDLAGRLIAAQEEERKHIARELHDDLNQQVAVLAITIGTFKRQISSTDVAGLEQISRLQETLVGMSEHIRRLSHELHSSVLQHVGPVVALRAYCQEFTDREGIALTVDIQDGFEPVSTDLSLCVYRVLQESLRNVARHSRTETAEVKLALVQDTVELHVTDHGVGFDPNLAESRKGLGLVSMEERVKLLRGTFQLKTRPGAGTEIKVRIPITGDQG